MTVLFADISGSTELGERLDPEAVRTLLSRHFAKARAILERHGGTVEKFIGDAVMAVFGVPVVREDDALRAVRAAWELQRSVSELNDDPAATARIAVRIGINTGEVVTGSTGETLVTGDAVNTAARLEQAAAPGEILVGAATYELVRDAVSVTAVEPIQARGKSAPVGALRVTAMVGDAGRSRTAGGSLVGREAELGTLQAAWDALDDRAKLVTVVAPAGVGKSRLISEFAGRLAGTALVAKGRCLSYGDGITYWPVREIVHRLGGIVDADSPSDARTKVDALVPGQPEIADAVAAAIGLEAQSVQKDDLFWAVRRLLETAGDRHSLLLLVEDLHWAEETMLDLLEYLAEMTVSPVLILATARPDLMTTRPGWAGATGTLLRLDPLGVEASETLLLAQEGAEALPADIRRRILDAADGNALYLEELIAVLRDRSTLIRDGDTWSLAATLETLDIPPTIHALLAARLDQLATEERAVVQHGAVIGRSFEAAAVAEIGPVAMRADLTRRLLALVRKELLRPDRGELTDGDAFRFRHILIRDAAYSALSKEDRALLHERFAIWLERAAGERIGEFQEIVAHHLEQALEYRRVLGETDLEELILRAARAMLAAGRRAANRDDDAAAVLLFRKAATLGRGTYEVESVALRELSELLQDAGAFVEVEDVLDRCLEIAEAAGHDRDAALARINRLFVHHHTQPATWVAEADAMLPDAIEILERAGDDAGLASAWHARCLAAWPDVERVVSAQDRSIAYARAAGDPRWLGWTVIGRAVRVIGDETPVAEGLALIDDVADEVAGLGSIFRTSVALSRATLEAMAGRTDEAVAAAELARETHRQFGHRMELANSTVGLVMIHLFSGRCELAEPAVRESIEFLEGIDEGDLRPYLCAHLARCLAMCGRYDEARAFVERARVDDADPVREAICQGTLARILAADGDHDAGIAAGEEAVRASPASTPNRRALALMDLADALGVAGHVYRARAALDEAWRLADRKGNVALVAVIERQREALLTASGSDT